MKKPGLFALATAALVVAASAEAHPLGPGYWSAGGYANICLLSDGTATANVAYWKGVWSAESYAGMETGTVVGGQQKYSTNDSLVIKGSNLVWNEWTDDLSYTGFLGNLQWTWLGHNCKNGPMKRGPLLAR